MLAILTGLMILVLLVLLRAIIGSTLIDRLISINALTSKISVIILLVAFLRDDFGIIDVAFVFMLCAFVGGLGVLKVVTHDDWKLKVSKLENPANDRKETN